MKKKIINNEDKDNFSQKNRLLIELVIVICVIVGFTVFQEKSSVGIDNMEHTVKKMTEMANKESDIDVDKFKEEPLSKNIEKKVIKFQKNLLKRNPKLKIKDIKVLLQKDLGYEGWYGFNLMIKGNIMGKDIEAPTTVFSNGVMITNELVGIKDNVSFKKRMYPTLTEKYYKDEYFIAGNKNAKHKMVIFSDPLCPVCIGVLPEIIKDVMKSPNNIALYHIHFPLDMHPTAKAMVKASYLAKKQGIKDVDLKIYTAGFEDDFDFYKEKDDIVMLKAFNKEFKTNIILSNLENKEFNDRIEEEIRITKEAMINGTPTIFFDNEIDPMRNKYLKYLN